MIMMHTWFECKIRYEKVMENGMNKIWKQKKLLRLFTSQMMAKSSSRKRIVKSMRSLSRKYFRALNISASDVTPI